MYSDSYDSNIPPIWYGGGWSKTEIEARWFFVIAKFIESNYKYYGNVKVGGGDSAMLCPSVPNRADLKYVKNSYSANYGSLFRLASLQTSWPGPGKFSRIKNPSSVMMAMDGQVVVISGVGYPPSLAYTIKNPGHAWPFTRDANGNGILDSASNDFNGASIHHSGKINALFIDGHAKTLGEREWTNPDLWEVKY